MCTAFYSCRLAFLVFLNKPNGFKKYIEHAHEPSLFMMIPLFTLAFGSIFAGFFFTIAGYSLSFLMIFYLPVSKLTTLFKYKKSSLIRTFYTFLSKK
jgi:NADH:ubiquinone oxidoreductase subunit 5 (subunit L)/multisubunit Na+/H+ antiporter MnhA subunit